MSSGCGLHSDTIKSSPLPPLRLRGAASALSTGRHMQQRDNVLPKPATARHHKSSLFTIGEATGHGHGDAGRGGDAPVGEAGRRGGALRQSAEGAEGCRKDGGKGTRADRQTVGRALVYIFGQKTFLPRFAPLFPTRVHCCYLASPRLAPAQPASESDWENVRVVLVCAARVPQRAA